MEEQKIELKIINMADIQSQEIDGYGIRLSLMEN